MNHSWSLTSVIVFRQYPPEVDQGQAKLTSLILTDFFVTHEEFSESTNRVQSNVGRWDGMGWEFVRRYFYHVFDIFLTKVILAHFMQFL